jgi:hypothetical protein
MIRIWSSWRIEETTERNEARCVGLYVMRTTPTEEYAHTPFLRSIVCSPVATIWSIPVLEI